MKVKVYCCDCAYYQEDQFIQAGGTSQSYHVYEECLSPENPSKEYDTYKCSMAIKSTPSELNGHNSCIYFQRKK